MLMNVMRKLNATNYPEKPGIWLLSSGAQSIGGLPASINLAQEGLRGVSRVVVNEFPLFKSRMVDFSTPVQSVEIDALIEELFSSDGEDEIAFRGKKRYFNKLERISKETIAFI